MNYSFDREVRKRPIEEVDADGDVSHLYEVPGVMDRPLGNSGEKQTIKKRHRKRGH